MSSPTQLLSRYPHKILTSFSLILSLNSTYQVCAMKKCTKKNEEEIDNMSITIDLMKGYMYGTALRPVLYGGSGVRRITIFEMMGHEREKDGESREKEELGNMERVKKNRKGEGGKKSEQEGDGPDPTTIKIAEGSSKVSDGSENAKIQSGDQDGKMREEDRSNEASEDVESVD
ncbi:hypothetical protein BPAE_0215g00030 [Botrytis paeoniae]|uniref:Uncharacterized protein n=1 Tax=Botrytis paeoniae TaxID=278948 RepID=A0A4Z1FIY0_9HELO|nr:hypothetical protein BPAE_0215g00030 [Botrytis paeoniae]